MSMTVAALAKLLHGEVNGGWLNIRGPGHSKGDRSLGIRLDPAAPDGFRVHSFANDDEGVCRALVKKKLKEISHDGSVCVMLDDTGVLQHKPGPHAGALKLYNQCSPIPGTLAGTYLASRKCLPTAGALLPLDLSFHAACPFGAFKFPALVALMRDLVTSEPASIQRIALKDDGSGKRDMPPGMAPKMMLGSSKSTAVMLYPPGPELGIAEGVETALSARQIFKVPVWAAMSAGGIRDFPIIYGTKFLRIFADHDEAGILAARNCKRRYIAAGIKVEIQYPPKPQNDWNDYHREEN